MILSNWTSATNHLPQDEDLYLPASPVSQPVVRAECGEYYTVDGFWHRHTGVSMLKLSRTNSAGEKKEAILPPSQIVDLPDGGICTDYELDCLLVRFRENHLEMA